MAARESRASGGQSRGEAGGTSEVGGRGVGGGDKGEGEADVRAPMWVVEMEEKYKGKWMREKWI
jgi:hypothetical protein